MDQLILAYAGKLTLHPQEGFASEVAALRDAGLYDRAILDICQLAAYFNFVNRLAQGLEVELESDPH